MHEPLVSPRYLFSFALPCKYVEKPWVKKRSTLDESCLLPDLAELESPGARPELRAAWNESCLVFRLEVHGKKQPPWCRVSRPEDSDGLQIWIDTRNVHTVHRANRFCHRFFFLPGGEGSKGDAPSAGVLRINRAREPHGPVNERHLSVTSEVSEESYTLHIKIDAKALTGFDPTEHPALGFTYALFDRELGEQTLGPGRPMPYDEDPSLWATLDLVR